MNRRQFLDTLVSGATASGIVLAVPRVILAEDKKEEEKPAMYAYPWDDIYNDKDRVVPGAKKIVSKDKFTLDSFAQGYSLFKDPKKMEKLFPKEDMGEQERFH